MCHGILTKLYMLGEIDGDFLAPIFLLIFDLNLILKNGFS